MEEDSLYKANSETYARTGELGKLTADSAGRVIFRTGKRNSYHYACKTCGAVKYIRPSDIERGRAQYCSQKCFNDVHPRCWFTCPICGTLFSLRYGRAMEYKTHYCSPECYNEAKSDLYVPVDLSPSPGLAYILGVMVGDGCGNEYTKKYKGKEKKSYDIKLSVLHYDFAKSFADALETIGLHPNLYLGKQKKYRGKNEQRLWCVDAYSKTFVHFYLVFKHNAEKMREFIEKCPEGKEGFIKGFYESEGHHGVYNYKTKTGIRHVRHLRMTNTDKGLINLVIAFLYSFGFHPYTDLQKREHLGWKDRIDIHLPPKEHERFLSTIRPVIKK